MPAVVCRKQDRAAAAVPPGTRPGRAPTRELPGRSRRRVASLLMAVATTSSHTNPFGDHTVPEGRPTGLLPLGDRLEATPGPVGRIDYPTHRPARSRPFREIVKIGTVNTTRCQQGFPAAQDGFLLAGEDLGGKQCSHRGLEVCQSGRDSLLHCTTPPPSLEKSAAHATNSWPVAQAGPKKKRPPPTARVCVSSFAPSTLAGIKPQRGNVEELGGNALVVPHKSSVFWSSPGKTADLPFFPSTVNYHF
jgi:hypothetical protein